MSELKNNEKEVKQEKLKEIIKQLHDGVSVDRLKGDFAKLIKNTSPEEIADMENALIQEGFPPEEIQRLCDVHVQVFEQSLKKVGKASKIPGHPIYTFMQENKEAKKILKNLVKSAKKIKKGKSLEDEISSFRKYFELLKKIELHYQRKENQLFPMLEAKQFSGPTKVMWGKHDEIRSSIRKTDVLFNEKEWGALSKQVNALSSAIKKMIFLEEKILYPTSARKLNDKNWAEIKLGGPEIGYAWVTPSNLWDANIAGAMATKKTEKIEQEAIPGLEEKKINLSQGQLTTEQVNLMLKTLPIDVTFVDENDKVCYYSDTNERIFPRSPAIIGREVQNCHPPNSVHIVNEIVNHFKAKKKDKAEFWLQSDGKFIHIRYFPVFDKKDKYRGVVEVSQEVSEIKNLTGERRLLDW